MLEIKNVKIEDRIYELPYMPLRDVVVFPYMLIPLFVGREFSIRAIEKAYEGDKLLFVSLQRDKEIEEPKEEDLYKVGTFVQIVRFIPIEEGKVKIIVQGLRRGIIRSLKKEGGSYFVEVEPVKEELEEDLKTSALVKNIKELLDRAIYLGKQIVPEVAMMVKGIKEVDKFSDLVASLLDVDSKKAQELLETFNVRERLEKINKLLSDEVKLLEIQQEIKNQAKEQIEKEQREYFLRQQLKAIQKELGELDERKEEAQEYRKKLEALKLSPQIKEEIERQIDKLEKMHPDSAEAGVLRTYLDWVLSLPWNKRTRDRYDIKRAKKILDSEHYDLEKVKDRIIEYLAVLKLTKGKAKSSQILCFIGPPGVGKTSLGKSIAKALGRKFVRISLGGIRDEAEIRGHRRTYVGAMPGRIIQAIKQAGTKNPLIMLDEIDKLSVSFQGDPSAALLEVLDPEQNKSFMDLYINLPFDLSEILFICTGNRVDTIPRPLLDRMEVIFLSGYSEEEKLQIAKKHIIPKLTKNHGFKEGEVLFEEEALKEIIRGYTSEAGVRGLQRQISAVLRKLAVKKLEGQNPPFIVRKEDLIKLLGVPRYRQEREEEPLIGIATGLAWTEVGGEIMYVEATKMRGSGKLILTGSLGEVMKESVQASLSYIRANAERFSINPEDFKDVDVHVHIPEGAVPKDGPSAGVAIATALLSLFTQKPVRMDVAMTGEITLRGRVLPVGGLKEKILAAKRAGIYEVILPYKNKEEVLEDLPPYVREKMKLHFVKNLEEVFKIAIFL